MKTVNLDLSYINDLPNGSTITATPLLIKGASTLNVVLTGVSESKFRVDFVEIDWGDGSSVETYKRDLFYNYKNQSIFNEVLYGKVAGSVMLVYSHNYSNDTTAYALKYTGSFTFYYNDGSLIYIEQPIIVYWGSFYDDVDRLSVLDTQIQPIATNDTFLNLESSKDRAIVVGALRDEGVPLRSDFGYEIEPLKPPQDYVYVYEDPNNPTVVDYVNITRYLATCEGVDIEYSSGTLITPNVKYI